MIIQVQEKNAGYCNGVANAIRVAEDTITERDYTNPDKTVWFSGPLVHNKVVNQRFLSMPKVAYYDPEKTVCQGDYLVIRAHGETKQIIDYCRDMGLIIKEGMCSKVKHMRQEAMNHSDYGKHVIIAGKIRKRTTDGSEPEYHPEVKGVVSYLKGGKYAVVENEEDTAELIGRSKDKNGIDPKQGITLVAQTTFNQKTYDAIYDMLLGKYPNVDRINSICPNMKLCQNHARELSKEASLMVVIGGKESSNTAELEKVCLEQMQEKMPATGREPNQSVYKIETAFEMQREWFREIGDHDIVGITAGLSTPPESIEEVVRQLQNWFESPEVKPTRWKSHSVLLV